MSYATSIVFVLYRSYGAEVQIFLASDESASVYAIKQKQIARPAICGTKQSALPKHRL